MMAYRGVSENDLHAFVDSQFAPKRRRGLKTQPRRAPGRGRARPGLPRATGGTGVVRYDVRRLASTIQGQARCPTTSSSPADDAGYSGNDCTNPTPREFMHRADNTGQTMLSLDQHPEHLDL